MDQSMFESVITSGQNAIRSMILINGGASVAVLAFLGHLATINPAAIPAFSACFVPFLIGTLFSGLVSGTTYVSQWLYAGDWYRTGLVLNVLAILLGIASYVAFGIGAWLTYGAFVQFPA